MTSSRMPTTRWQSVAIAMALLTQAMQSMAEQGDGPPRNLLFTRGPAGTVHGLSFTTDSQRLIAAGRDKVTHTWDVSSGVPLRGPGRPTVTHIAASRWEISRGPRGAINTLSHSPVGNEVAIAGVSARNDGDIILLDEGTRQVKTSLPRSRDGRSGRPGHMSSVQDIDFAPDGEQLVSVDWSGEVLLWAPDNGARTDWTATTLRPSIGASTLDSRVAFVSKRMVAVAAPSARGAPWGVTLYTTERGRPRPIATLPLESQRITDLTKDLASDRWAASDVAGRVWLFDGVREQRGQILRQTGLPVGCLTFVGNQQMVIGVRAGNGRPPTLELYDTANGRLLDTYPGNPAAPGFSVVANSPDGNFLATQDVATNQMLLFALRDGQGRPIAKPLSSKAPMRFGGRGRSIRSIAFAERGYRLGFGVGESIDSVFDFQEGNLSHQPGQERWRLSSAVNRSGSWSIRPPERARNRLVVELRKNGRPYRIQLNDDFQGQHACHAFIPGRGGEPVGVAIGTDAQSGIFLYRLPVAPNESIELVRYFRDHSDRVSSISVSADGKYLASGAMDQTIKVWPLRDAFARDPRFAKRSAWGATFTLRGGRVVVGDIDPAGIAHARGLRNGDVVRVIMTSDESGRTIVGQQPGEILDVLRRQPIYKIAQIQITRDGEAKPRDFLPLVTPAWEPLMTLFVANSGEWAVWTPTGYFDSSLAEGGDLFGWQFNRGRDQPPRVVRGAFLQKELERPEVIRRLLGAGSLDAALAASQPTARKTDVVQEVRETPDVRIESPANGSKLRAAKKSTLVAKVKLPPNKRAADFEVRASAGGRNLGPPRLSAQDAQELTFEWPVESFDPLNRLQVIASERGQPAIRSRNASDTVHVRGDSRPEVGPKYKLHVFAMACENYAGDPKQGQFGPLQYTIDDAEAIVGMLREKQDELGFYELAPSPTFLRDSEVTRSRVEREISSLEGRFSPVGKRDIVLVYLHGHGKVKDGVYYFVPTSALDDKRLEAEGIPWSTLSRIANRRCHVIWMIDTCESGVAAKAVRREVRKATRAILREARQAMTLAIAAVPGKEATPESPLFRGYGREGGTAYAASVLEAIDGKADGFHLIDEVRDGRRVEEILSTGEADRRVSLAELVLYLKDTIPRKLRDAGSDEPNPPGVAPSGLLETTSQIPLVRTPG